MDAKDSGFLTIQACHDGPADFKFGSRLLLAKSMAAAASAMRDAHAVRR
jgi:hypothetical protein